MDGPTPGIWTMIGHIMEEAAELSKLYQNQDGVRESFARYVRAFKDVIELVRGTAPQRATPVVLELKDLVRTATAKLTKMASTPEGPPSKWRLIAEEETMRTTMQRMRQLLPLFLACCAPASVASESAAYLRRRGTSLQRSAPDAAAHLVKMQVAMSAVAAPHAQEEQVKQCMAMLHAGIVQLSDAGLVKVLVATDVLQQQLVEGRLSRLLNVEPFFLFPEKLELLRDAGSAHFKQVLALQRDMRVDLQKVQDFLWLLSGSISATAWKSMQETRIAAAISDLISLPAGELSPFPATHAQWASAIRAAAFAGQLTVTSCCVLGIPMMPEGPLRPVLLPCCGSTVSDAGAQQLFEKRMCRICKRDLAADALVASDWSIAAAVTAEARGYVPRRFDRDEVVIGALIGSGAQGDVFEGTTDGRSIAVKKIPMHHAAHAPNLSGKLSAMNHVSRTYLAGLGSVYMCSLHGYCWTADGLWLVLERCDGSLVDLVRTAGEELGAPGLPPADVTALGLMLCSALRAMHAGACCAHRYVQPRDVLLAVPAATADATSTGRSVRLADAPPSWQPRASEPWSGVPGETGVVGYAPMEQVLGRAHDHRCSDIFSLGATLLYAATGVHWFGTGDAKSTTMKTVSGMRVPIPDRVEPVALKGLLADMTSIEPAWRPTLSQVQQRLLQVHNALIADGASAHFIAAVDGTLMAADGIVTPLKDPVLAGDLAAAEARESGLTRGSDTTETEPPACRTPRGDAWLKLLLDFSISASASHNSLCRTLHRLVSAFLLHLRSCVLATCGRVGQDAHACPLFKHVHIYRDQARSSLEPAEASSGLLSDLLKMLSDTQGEAGGRGHTDNNFSTVSEPVTNDRADGICCHTQEEPQPAVVQRLGYGAILLGKADARLSSPAFTLRQVLTGMSTAAVMLARCLECLQALQRSCSGQDERSSVISISQKLFLHWADFASGMMQLLQGAISVAAALRCSVSSDFITATSEQLNIDKVTGYLEQLQLPQGSKVQKGILPGEEQDACASHDGEILPDTESGLEQAEGEPLKRPRDQRVNDTEAEPHYEKNVENIKAVFIPNLLIRLGMKHIRLLLSGKDGSEVSSEGLDGLKLFVQANVMRMNWSNAAASDLWKSLPVKIQEAVQQMRTVSKCPVTNKFYRPEGPQLPLARRCCGAATSEEGLHRAANEDGQIPCANCKKIMQASDVEECDVFEAEFDAACMADSVELQSFLQPLPATGASREDKQEYVADHKVSPADIGTHGPSISPDAISALASELGRDIFWESPKVASFVERLPLRGVPVEQKATSAAEFLQLYDLDGFLGLPDTLAPAQPADSRAVFLTQAEQQRLRQVCTGERAAGLHPAAAALVQAACTLANPPGSSSSDEQESVPARAISTTESLGEPQSPSNLSRVSLPKSESAPGEALPSCKGLESSEAGGNDTLSRTVSGPAIAWPFVASSQPRHTFVSQDSSIPCPPQAAPELRSAMTPVLSGETSTRRSRGSSVRRSLTAAIRLFSRLPRRSTRARRGGAATDATTVKGEKDAAKSGQAPPPFPGLQPFDVPPGPGAQYLPQYSFPYAQMPTLYRPYPTGRALHPGPPVRPPGRPPMPPSLFDQDRGSGPGSHGNPYHGPWMYGSPGPYGSPDVSRASSAASMYAHSFASWQSSGYGHMEHRGMSVATVHAASASSDIHTATSPSSAAASADNWNPAAIAHGYAYTPGESPYRQPQAYYGPGSFARPPAAPDAHTYSAPVPHGQRVPGWGGPHLRKPWIPPPPPFDGAPSLKEFSSVPSRAVRSSGWSSAELSFLPQETPSWSEFQQAAADSESPLDALEVALDAMCSMKSPFYGRYLLLSSVERRVGGQGLVQFASITNTQEKAAIKFYMDKAAFKRERDLYEDSALKTMMPATLAIDDNAAEQCRTPYGYVFPPFVIMECGQSLDEWARDNANKDFITVFQALSHSVRALRKLHSTGYAHRDIKPGNILRLPKQHDWTLIDFGCAAQIGETVGMAFSLKYAPPEVMQALEAGCRTIAVDAAVDIWAIGVIAFELLTGERAFPAEGLSVEAAEKAAQDAIIGRTPLPWELGAKGAAARLRKMRGLKRTVLRCLERDALKRPSAEALLKSWHTFDDMQTRGTDWSMGSGDK